MENTIVAIATATGESGIGIVRLSGEKSIDIVKKIFKPYDKKEIDKKSDRMMKYGHIYDKDEIIDEVMVCFMFAPHTYTREHVVEIFTHGGIVCLKRVLNLCLENGADLAEKGEFTKRAFLNGRLDLSQAEGVIDLIKAKTEFSHKSAINQLEGHLSKKIKEFREELLDILSFVEYSINFTEDMQEELPFDNVILKTEKLMAEMEELLGESNKGKILKDGIDVSIIGKPNVGKSSLLNRILRQERAIVTDIAGTTRDLIKEDIELSGIKLNINDTAGIRDTADVVEKIGVQKSIEASENSDLNLVLFDISRELDEEDEKIINLANTTKSIGILNKVDLDKKLNEEKLKEKVNFELIEISALKNEGISKLEQAIIDMFFDGKIEIKDKALITNVRHENSLKSSLEYLKSFYADLKNMVPIDCCEVDLRRAYEVLGEIIGENISENILDNIFSNFCIGK